MPSAKPSDVLHPGSFLADALTPNPENNWGQTAIKLQTLQIQELHAPIFIGLEL
jgi:hypothetical protein